MAKDEVRLPIIILHNMDYALNTLISNGVVFEVSPNLEFELEAVHIHMETKEESIKVLKHELIKFEDEVNRLKGIVERNNNGN